MTHRIIRRPEVQNLTALSKSTIYLRISKGTFPSPIPLGGRLVGWLEADIQNWIESKIEKQEAQENA